MDFLRSFGWSRNGVWMGVYDFDDEGYWKWVEGNFKGKLQFLYLFILKLIMRYLIIIDSYEIKVKF